MTYRRTLLTLALTALLAPALGHAADFPVRPVTLVVPFAPGGPTDAMGNELVSVSQADLYIKAANKSIESEERRQERDAKRKQKEEEKAEAPAEGQSEGEPARIRAALAQTRDFQGDDQIDGDFMPGRR